MKWKRIALQAFAIGGLAMSGLAMASKSPVMQPVAINGCNVGPCRDLFDCPYIPALGCICPWGSCISITQ